MLWGQIKKAPDGAKTAIKRRKNPPFFKIRRFLFLNQLLMKTAHPALRATDAPFEEKNG